MHTVVSRLHADVYLQDCLVIHIGFAVTLQRLIRYCPPEEGLQRERAELQSPINKQDETEDQGLSLILCPTMNSLNLHRKPFIKLHVLGVYIFMLKYNTSLCYFLFFAHNVPVFPLRSIIGLKNGCVPTGQRKVQYDCKTH